MNKLKNLIISSVLSTIVLITSFLITSNSLEIGYPKLKFIQNILFIPVWLFQVFFTYLDYVFPLSRYTADGEFFLTLFYPIIFVFWFFIFLLYFKICGTYLKEIQKKVAYFIPLIFILIIVMPTMLVYLNKEDLFTEACLSGEYSRILGVSDEGAMSCLRSELIQKLGLVYSDNLITPMEKSYRDAIKFCADLSDVKLAATNTDQTLGEIVPPSTTYRDYCFIRLADLMSSNVLEEKTRGIKSEELESKYHDILENKNSEYWNIVRKACNESGKSSGLQKEQDCINYFNQYK